MFASSFASADCNGEISEQKREIIAVPWYNATQFKKVYECLYSPELVKKRWALDQISVWETRCHPSLPAAIEASYGLTSAIVQDILWTNGASVNQQLDIQCIYSAAITRFVNLTVDLQNDYPQTLTMAAKGLGIPSFIVDLRNEASHSVRPSLSCLRIAAEAAMKYLKESYWEKEASTVKNHIKVPTDLTDLNKLIFDYVMQGVDAISLREKSLPDLDSEYFSKLDGTLEGIRMWIKKDKRLFIQSILPDGFFIPYDEDLKPFVSAKEFEQFQKAHEEPIKTLHPDIEAVCMPSVPQYHEELWYDVIDMLNDHDAVPMFLESLLRTQGDRTVAGQKLIVAWVLKLFRLQSAAGRPSSSLLAQIFRKKGMVVNWYTMFYAAVANPSKYTPFILPLIYYNLDFGRLELRRMISLMAIYLGQAKDLGPEVDNIFTVEQLKRSKQMQTKAISRSERGTRRNIWSLPSDDDYKTWPIGLIVNPTIQEDDEQLEEDSFDVYNMKYDFVEKFIRVNNKNVNEEKSLKMDSEDSYNFEDDIKKELENRKSFLYKK